VTGWNNFAGRSLETPVYVLHQPCGFSRLNVHFKLHTQKYSSGRNVLSNFNKQRNTNTNEIFAKIHFCKISRVLKHWRTRVEFFKFTLNNLLWQYKKNMFFVLFSQIHVAFGLNSVQLCKDKEHKNTWMKQRCDDFPNAPIYEMHGGWWEAAKDQGSSRF